jgi:hypothetical protein
MLGEKSGKIPPFPYQLSEEGGGEGVRERKGVPQRGGVPQRQRGGVRERGREGEGG